MVDKNALPWTMTSCIIALCEMCIEVAAFKGHLMTEMQIKMRDSIRKCTVFI